MKKLNVEITTYKLQCRNYNLQIAMQKLQLRNYKVEITTYKLQSRNYKLQQFVTLSSWIAVKYGNILSS